MGHFWFHHYRKYITTMSTYTASWACFMDSILCTNVYIHINCFTGPTVFPTPILIWQPRVFRHLTSLFLAFRDDGEHFLLQYSRIARLVWKRCGSLNKNALVFQISVVWCHFPGRFCLVQFWPLVMTGIVFVHNQVNWGSNSYVW